MHFHTKEEKKSLEKKIKWKKNPVDFPPLPIFSDSELSPTYLPLPPFSSKSKNIQLEKYKTKKGRSRSLEKTKNNETCIKQPAAQHPRMRFQRSYQKHITCTHWIKTMILVMKNCENTNLILMLKYQVHWHADYYAALFFPFCCSSVIRIKYRETKDILPVDI